MRRTGIAVLVVVGLVLAGDGQAQSGVTGPPTGSGATVQSAPARAQLAAQLVTRWANHIQEVYKTTPEQWASSMAPLFERASVDTLARAAARTFDAMNDELLRGDLPKASPIVLGDIGNRLGDAASDLTFVPIAPCRIIDTRVSGGILTAGGTSNFDVADVTSYAFQGGDASNCNGLGAAGSFAAVAINFTVVSPTAGGYITAYPFNGVRPLAATMVYAAGEVLSNLSIVRLDQTSAAYEMSIYSWATTHLVADVVGYFIAPQATPLDCVETFTSQSRAAGLTFNFQIPACPAGYSVTGAGCRTPGYNDATWAINGLFRSPTSLQLDAFCAGTVVNTTTIEGIRQCCRVPGR